MVPTVLHLRPRECLPPSGNACRLHVGLETMASLKSTLHPGPNQAPPQGSSHLTFARAVPLPWLPFLSLVLG